MATQNSPSSTRLNVSMSMIARAQERQEEEQIADDVDDRGEHHHQAEPLARREIRKNEDRKPAAMMTSE